MVMSGECTPLIKQLYRKHFGVDVQKPFKLPPLETLMQYGG